MEQDSSVSVIYSLVCLVSDPVSDVSPRSLLWPGQVFLPGHQLSFPVSQLFSLQIRHGSRPRAEGRSHQDCLKTNPRTPNQLGGNHTHLFQFVRQKFNFFFIFVLLFRILQERSKHYFLKRRERGDSKRECTLPDSRRKAHA